MLVYYIIVVLVGAWDRRRYEVMSKSMDGVPPQLEVKFLPWSIFSSWSKIFFLTSTNNHFSYFLLESHSILTSLWAFGLVRNNLDCSGVFFTGTKLVFLHGSTCLLAYNAKNCPIGHTFRPFWGKNFVAFFYWDRDIEVSSYRLPLRFVLLIRVTRTAILGSSTTNNTRFQIDVHEKLAYDTAVWDTRRRYA